MPVSRLKSDLNSSTDFTFARLPYTCVMNVQYQMVRCMIFTAAAAVPSATEGIVSPDGRMWCVGSFVDL